MLGLERINAKIIRVNERSGWEKEFADFAYIFVLTELEGLIDNLIYLDSLTNLQEKTTGFHMVHYFTNLIF